MYTRFNSNIKTNTLNITVYRSYMTRTINKDFLEYIDASQINKRYDRLKTNYENQTKMYQTSISRCKSWVTWCNTSLLFATLLQNLHYTASYSFSR